ncbi:hypothetical protein [Naasia sp. SYSU D00948]|uniref:PH-like domain-containing protein n=1 Tax=Naasia sp. SYSU D00948 TaxID=2817379 RepID=UPI0027DB2611|nr:hypothetical protein [Naasia sp. SYSU D00948]
MPSQLIPTLVLAVFAALAGVGMLAGWRRRARGQAALGPVAELPTDPGVPAATAEALYVATTLRDQPLERVAVAGLGHRAQATVQVFPGGVSLVLTGRDAAWIPAAELDAAGLASWTIDRGVEPDGLVRLGWRLGGTPVDTYLRPRSASDATHLLDAVQGILPGAVASRTDPSEREN